MREVRHQSMGLPVVVNVLERDLVDLHELARLIVDSEDAYQLLVLTE